MTTSDKNSSNKLIFVNQLFSKKHKRLSKKAHGKLHWIQFLEKYVNQLTRFLGENTARSEHLVFGKKHWNILDC